MSTLLNREQLRLPINERKHIANKSDCAVVDLFCGVGGITHGFHLEGFNVVAGLDIDEKCRHAYEHNNQGSQFIKADIITYDRQHFGELYPQNKPVRIMIGCAPCQPFSTNNSKRTKQDNKDEKWKLVGEFAEVIATVRPEIVSMENVPNLRSFNDGKVLATFLEKLRGLGYHVFSDVIACAPYGVPQSRRRLVVLASLYGDIFMLPGTRRVSEYKTVRATIGDLPRIAAGETSDEDRLHKTRALSPQNMKRIQASVPGGTWEGWDEELQATCHRKATGSTYKGVYGRMEWDKVAPTITTEFFAYGSGRFGHPEQDRALSLREGAMLQTFPLDYEFVAPTDEITFKALGTHIGNAVPVDVARAIARSIAYHLGARD